MASAQFQNFKDTLAKVFMLDHAELDFGIYRIMNQKRKEIEDYLNNTLAAEVKQVLEDNMGSRVNELRTQLRDAENNARSLGIDPNNVPSIQTLKQQIATEGSPEDMENEVYSHLSTFFRRYYDGGDFISQRRYKKDVYAIPYEGEEVKLHWANADQYYIKTSEYFRTYNFKLSDGKLVEFTLKEASTEQNNNQNVNGLERRFAIYEECPVEVKGNILHINFTYELMPKATKQKDLLTAAYDTAKPLIPAEFAEVFSERPTDGNSHRTLLEKHLTDYVARNTFDYFIHKDLKGFLSRELDFFIKNEVLFIDDINAKDEKEFTQHLTVIKALKAIGTKIIEFLSQIENFQKKLWLKKKFVTDCNWCITLDRINEEFYEEIAANDKQREEWVKLFAIDEIRETSGDLMNPGKYGYSNPLTVQFLKENQYLLVDTAFYDDTFKRKLIASIENIDTQCDGLLINSENFQALNLLKEKYKSEIRCIYIDPPYNTSASEIIYKNNYKHSAWLSLMDNRLSISSEYIQDNGMIQVAIDDMECHVLKLLLDSNFGQDNYVASLVVQHNPRGRADALHISPSHEYLHIYAKNYSMLESNQLVQSADDLKSKYGKVDDVAPYRELPFKRSGSNSRRIDRPNLFYPIYYNESTKQLSLTDDGSSIKILPLDQNGEERCWRWGIEKAKLLLNKDIIAKLVKNKYVLYTKDRLKVTIKPKTVWVDAKYDASSYGTALLKDLFVKPDFSYPKSINAVHDALSIGCDDDSIVMDYFAGSGTTGHAIINLNREDGGHRKYILFEMGEYFNSTTKPRIQKNIYSDTWRNGKPISREGISQCFKYMRLESYEDTLNNLVPKSPASDIFAGSDQYKESYLLGYMLDMETKDSLFNSKWFEHPFDVKLKVTKNNELIEQKIDIVETFNYLIGLNVETMQWPREGICIVEGKTSKGEKTLVIWRDVEKISNEKLEDIFTRLDFSTKDSEFDRIYINGDNNLQNLRTDESHWKVLLTEEEFEKAMFSE